MVKAYLRYERQHTLGVIASLANSCPILYAINPDLDTHKQKGDLVWTPALNDVLLWSIKQDKVVARLRGEKDTASVTALAQSSDGRRVAVGYSDGRVAVFRRPLVGSGTTTMTTTTAWERDMEDVGHTRGVTCLSFSDVDPLSSDGSQEPGHELVSGGGDGELVLWDVIGGRATCRLRGHKDRITQAVFLSRSGLILSASKDTLLKLWEPETQHCIQTLVGTHHEVWAFAVDPQECRLIVGSVDRELRVWNIAPLHRQQKHQQKQNHNNNNTNNNNNLSISNGASVPIYRRPVVFLGSLFRKSENRVLQIKFSRDGSLLCVAGMDHYVEVFGVTWNKDSDPRNEDASLPSSSSSSMNKTTESEDNDLLRDLTVKRTESSGQQEDDKRRAIENDKEMQATRIQIVRVTYHIRTFDVHPAVPLSSSSSLNTPSSRHLPIVIGTSRNTIYQCDITGSRKDPVLYSVQRQGHRTPVRALCMSGDDKAVASVSNGDCLVWALETGRLVRHLGCGYAVCAQFLPGDRYIVVGTKEGELELLDIQAAELVDRIVAHSGPVWSMCPHPDGRGIISASGDKTLKFWEFELVSGSSLQPQGGGEGEGGARKKRLGLSLQQVVRLGDEALSVSCSPDGRFLAVALLDCTVKVFYLDTMRFFLSLYGHKLPVTAMSISSDSTIIATVSADKNLKLWGLDFGDCHRSLFAHHDGIMDVRFVRDTHYVFTAGKDGALKYWDVDTYDCVQELRPETGNSALWSLALSTDGERVIGAGHERAIFVFQRTDEQLFLEEEQERRMEEQFDRSLETTQQFSAFDSTDDINRTGNPDSSYQSQSETAHPGKRTMVSVKSGEQLMEDIELVMQEEQQQKDYETTLSKGLPADKPTPHVVFTALRITPIQYLWRSLRRIPRAHLDVALTVLPQSHAFFIMEKIDQLLQTHHIDIELATRIVLVLVQLHQAAISTDASFAPTLVSLTDQIKKHLRSERNRIGFNISAMQHIGAQIDNGIMRKFKELDYSTGIEQDESVLGKRLRSLDKNNPKKKKQRI